MKKYTKKQRNDIYRKAYKIAEQTNFMAGIPGYTKHVGLCYTIYLAARNIERRGSYDKLLQDLTELWLIDPLYKIIYWYDHTKEGKSERLTALAFMIAMTNN